MIELPEALTLAKQLNETVTGAQVVEVSPPTKPHKFCWFNGEPTDYAEQLIGQRVRKAEGFGIYCEITFDGGKRLCVNDGVNVRLCEADKAPKSYQLMIAFSDGRALVFTVAMCGGIFLHSGDYDNEYYLKSRSYVSPLSDDFYEQFRSLIERSKGSMSAKAFLATQQRFPGIGNGVLQDILFDARINPRRKLSTLSDEERGALYRSTVSVIKQMTELGGRDTERDIFGSSGGYVTRMSKNSLASGCPECGGDIIKETYLGGSVYYCPDCQPLE